MTYTEARAQLDAIAERLAAGEKAAEDAESKYSDMLMGSLTGRVKARRDSAKSAELDQLRDAALAARDATERDKLLLAIQADNTRAALLAELKPAALAILAKYNGKPYGPKTADKISDAMKEATGYRMRISHEYSRSRVDFYPATGYHWPTGFDRDLTISYFDRNPDGDRRPILTADNKIDTTSAAAFTGYNADAIDAPEKRADEIRAALAALNEAAAAYNAAVGAYNALLPTKGKRAGDRVYPPHRPID